jgi:prephenate dehydrogenase
VTSQLCMSDYKKNIKVADYHRRRRADRADSPITPLIDGHAVSRISDFIIYSVESSSIIPIVREYGPSTKMGATVAGQTSVKAPEKEAFEKYLPGDVDIVSVHSLHGPTVTTEGQPLVSPLEFCNVVLMLDHHPSSWTRGKGPNGRRCI